MQSGDLNKMQSTIVPIEMKLNDWYNQSWISVGIKPLVDPKAWFTERTDELQMQLSECNLILQCTDIDIDLNLR